MSERPEATPQREQQRQQHERRPYSMPRLMTYGAVRELTAAGTAGKKEFFGLSPKRRP